MDTSQAVADLLLPAFRPCAAFGVECPSMRWDPARGHVPRGFCGATASLEDVRLVLISAEPGDPHEAERHAPGGTPNDQLQSALSYAYDCFRDGPDLFHRNIRYILDLAFPGLSFDQQLRHTWLTDSVKCSAPIECGPVPAGVAGACRDRYLEKELALFPHAHVFALGRKAARRLKDHPSVYEVGSAAAPYGTRPAARASWEVIAAAMRDTTEPTPRARATRASWRHSVLPKTRERIGLQGVYSFLDFVRIQRGFIPDSMDDRWFAYYECPWLHLHRSWTGFEVFRVRFTPRATGMGVAEVLVNREPSQFASLGDKNDENCLSELLEALFG